MTIIGYDFWGIKPFSSTSTPIQNIKRIEVSNAIYDEIHLREKTDIPLSSEKEDWQMDTLLLAQFKGDLEAGNINNQGIAIDKFAIKRRRVTELKSITLGYKDFINNHQFVFEDYTQGNDDYIYSIVPVGENGLEGQENSIQISSNFAGWFLVDKDSNKVLAFDKFFDNNPQINVGLNQNQIQIDTLSKYPNFYRTPQNYHTFSVSGVIIPNDYERSNDNYKYIQDNFISPIKPFLMKSSNGALYVVNVSSPSYTTPQNAYKKFDYITITLNFTEIMDYEKYLDGDK